MRKDRDEGELEMTQATFETLGNLLCSFHFDVIKTVKSNQSFGIY